MITIDATTCTGCGSCADECPARIFVMEKDTGNRPRTEPAYFGGCNRCGHCVAICPVDAIVHDELPQDGFNPVSDGFIDPDALQAFMLSRRSTRSFKDNPVPKEVMDRLIEAATHAGTASNLQSEGFVVVQDRSLLAKLEKVVLETLWNNMKPLGNRLGRRLARLKYGEETAEQTIAYYDRFKTMKEKDELKDAVFRGAPAAIAIHGQRTNLLVRENCAIAARNIELLAQSFGLGTCWAGFLLVAAGMDHHIARHLDIPADRNIFSALMIGHPKHSYRKTVPRRQRDVKWM